MIYGDKISHRAPPRRIKSQQRSSNGKREEERKKERKNCGNADIVLGENEKKLDLLPPYSYFLFVRARAAACAVTPREHAIKKYRVAQNHGKQVV